MKWFCKYWILYYRFRSLKRDYDLLFQMVDPDYREVVKSE